METDGLSDYVYLDWAATAPLCQQAADAMQPFLVPGKQNIAFNANANSLHSPGRAAFSMLEQARRSISHDIGASRPSEVIFTSGSTEANNMALFGLVQAVRAQGPACSASMLKPLVVTSSIEHDAVLKPLRRMAREEIELVELEPNHQGFIEPEALERILIDRPDSCPLLVSIQMANGEIGTIQPIEKLVQIAHAQGALFHTDATQALGKVPFDVQMLGVDAASLSAHKIGGPKGVGALYLKARTPFCPQMLGGGQEEGRRSTTQNVCGAQGFAAACHEVLESMDEEVPREREMRDWLYEQLLQVPGVQASTLPEKGSTDHLPHIVNVVIDGIESATMILRLDKRGFGVSGGSACSSHSLDPSHVLKSIGIDNDLAQNELRVSFGHLTSQDDLVHFVQAFTDCLGDR